MLYRPTSRAASCTLYKSQYGTCACVEMGSKTWTSKIEPRTLMTRVDGVGSAGGSKRKGDEEGQKSSEFSAHCWGGTGRQSGQVIGI